MASDGPGDQIDPTSLRRLARAFPLFFVFFTWGFGSGAVQLARPLFAFEVSDSVFLVTLMVTITATSRIVTSPLTGYLTDRLGRKPLVLLGAGLRGAGSLGLFFVDSYVMFVAVEFVAQIGVSMFQTSVSVLIADVTSRETRGRFIALRTISSRIGHVAGPATAGLIAAAFSFQHVFLFDAVTKWSIVLVVLLLIRETRPLREARPAPARASRPAGDGEADRPITLRTFANTTFIALGAATVAWTMMQQGIFYSVLPVHAQEQVGITPAELGALVSFAGLLAILVAYPNGLVSDRLGRKFSLVPGLLILAAGMALLSVSPAYIVLVWAMAAYGLGEGMTMGTTQAVVMDLAPARARGTFIGVWSLLRSLAGVSIPLLIGGVYEFVGAAAAFGLVAGWMLVAAGLVVGFAKETGGRSRPERGPGS